MERLQRDEFKASAGSDENRNAMSAVLFAILLLAYLIRGITGFGSGLIAVPLLALFEPLQLVVPVVLALDFIASFILGGTSAKGASWREIRLLLPFGLIGASIGVFALVRLPAAPLLVALGLFAAFFGVRNLLGIQPAGQVSALWAAPAGLAGGGAGAVFGTSAPPYIIYLTHRLQDKSVVRATFSWLFVIDGGFRLALFAATGLLLEHQTLLAIALGVIPMALGLFIGHQFHIKVSARTMLRIVGMILLASGASLVCKVAC